MDRRLIARTIALDLMRQDGIEAKDGNPFPHEDVEGLSWIYIDQGTVDFGEIADALIPIIQEGLSPEACDSCGSTESMASLKAAGKLACCPERMLSAAQWRARAVAAETRYTASGYVEIEERQLGKNRWMVMINRNGVRTLWESYPSQDKAVIGKRMAEKYLLDVASSLPAPEGWVITDSYQAKFRFMDQGFFQWTSDLSKAMFFATRASADQAAAEDLDAVFIVKRPIPKEA
jgi:hypothetical protein